ncbi:uncharacterized protein B0I36DRAFT_361531 [Microdochium trichocladiopsis]|uniref:Thioesterase/thiol ester dehydrase-isomerase n=1 Tax=Microdochium trichocladiopsis TaxID=1682393 RepID=A0A9P8YAF4_9PEZI|nr:uncharacterized protein B0I36DRAFT_361531 [Microdochium trichocladiopsis]KAH7032759.1 hypothetical protein B0I36DRAFT_361531 [Microdochium trichocladiopsis]
MTIREAPAAGKPVLGSPSSHRSKSQMCFSTSTTARQSSSSTTAPTPSSSTSSTTTAPNARWIDDLRGRIGKCITFGCDASQVARSAKILAALSAEWRDLLAGSHGFITPGILAAGDLMGEQQQQQAGNVGNVRMGLQNHAVAWGDMDSFGHVNNTVYNKWAESARVNWLLHFAALDPANAKQWRQLMTMKHIGFIMQSITTKYKMPIVYPDTISVYYRLTKPVTDPSSTTTTPYLNLQSLILTHKHRRIAATTDESVVVYDYQAASKTDLPGFAAPLFGRTWNLQQVVAGRAQQRIAELVRAVEDLEKDTWDREDAKEDFGSSKQ